MWVWSPTEFRASLATCPHLLYILLPKIRVDRLATWDSVALAALPVFGNFIHESLPLILGKTSVGVRKSGFLKMANVNVYYNEREEKTKFKQGVRPQDKQTTVKVQKEAHSLKLKKYRREPNDL